MVTRETYPTMSESDFFEALEELRNLPLASGIMPCINPETSEIICAIRHLAHRYPVNILGAIMEMRQGTSFYGSYAKLGSTLGLSEKMVRKIERAAKVRRTLRPTIWWTRKRIMKALGLTGSRTLYWLPHTGLQGGFQS